MIRVNWKDLTDATHFDFIGSSSSETGRIIVPNIPYKKGNNSGRSLGQPRNHSPTADEFVGFNPLKKELNSHIEIMGREEHIYFLEWKKIRAMTVVLKLAYDRTCRSYELSGWMFLIGSVFINCPWIILLYYLNDTTL